jgi:hypothetical protein
MHLGCTAAGAALGRPRLIQAPDLRPGRGRLQVVHHAQVGSVPFDGAAWLRPVYFGLLVPHVVLAALVVPLALTTIHRAWRGRFDCHRRLARMTLPIWLYVSVSGDLVYVLLYHPVTDLLDHSSRHGVARPALSDDEP